MRFTNLSQSYRFGKAATLVIIVVNTILSFIVFG